VTTIPPGANAEDCPTCRATSAALRPVTRRVRDHKARAFPTPIEVLSIDAAADTASVIVVGWHLTRPVEFPLDPIVAATGIAAEALPGRWLEAVVNCYAADARELVFHGIALAPDLPEVTDGRRYTSVARVIATGPGTTHVRMIAWDPRRTIPVPTAAITAALGRPPEVREALMCTAAFYADAPARVAPAEWRVPSRTVPAEWLAAIEEPTQ